MRNKEKISINVIYDKELKRITGKYAEQFLVPSLSTSLDLLNLLFNKYPKIQNFPPGVLGFERNGKIPQSSQILEHNDRYQFVVRDDEISEFDMKVLQAVADEGDEGFLVPVGSEKEIEKMLDCAWKRIPCGQDSCPICGRINRDRKKFIARGKDPDLPESVFESVGAQFAETLAMVKKDAERMGIDITNLENVEDVPEPESFPLSVKAERWYKTFRKYIEEEEKSGVPWLLTEEFLDIIWYAGILNTKIYRQLCNRWYMDNKKGYGDFDYQYTAKVLKQVCRILDNAFKKLMPVNPYLRQFQKIFSELKVEVVKL